MEPKNSDSNSVKNVWTKIQSDLFPVVNPLQLIGKITLIHLGLLSLILTVCPQFGFGLFKNGHYGLTSIFMQVSHEFCQLACGVLLFGSTAFALHLNLKITEKEWLVRNQMAFISLSLFLTSSLFWMIAPDIYLFSYVIWAAGGAASLWAYFEFWTPVKSA